MCKVKLLCIILFGICSVKGQNFIIYMEFLNGILIFKWTNVSKYRNDIVITKDSQSSTWTPVHDLQYTVDDVMQYKSVKIQVREYKNADFSVHDDFKKTYNVNILESIEGESQNISWTADFFPRIGNYIIFHVYNDSAKAVINIIEHVPYSTEKYAYYTKPNPQDIQLEVRNISVTDAGYYIGNNVQIDAKSAKGQGAVLVVHGKPVKPTIAGAKKIKVGSSAKLKCVSRSTSLPNYYKKFPALAYSWYVNNNKQRGWSAESYRFVVTKDVKNNRYSCQVNETVESERSEEIQIIPLYGPERVLITPQPPQEPYMLTVSDGDQLGTYTCSADCYPPCTVQWRYEHLSGHFVDVTTTSTLSQLTANRSKMKLIQCVAKNTEGQRSKSIRLNILYLSTPTILLSHVNSDKQIRSDIREGDSLQISCSVEGNPTPTIYLGRASHEQILKQENTHRLNHTLPRAQCSDTGTYRCTGRTNEHGSKHKDFTVNVTCEPCLDMSVSVPFKNTYGSKSGQNVKVVVTVPVLANPFPSSVYSRISWQGPRGNYLNISNIVSQRDNVVYKYWINSTIPVPNPESFGNYSLIYNKKSVVNITINAEDSPKPPLNFTWNSDARGHVNLTWISNFNGGPEQFFILSQMKESGWTSIENLTDSGEGNLRYHDLGPLTPGPEYLYQLESCNRINCSLSPVEVGVKVKAPPISSLSLFGDNTMLILVGASAAGFVLVVVLTVAVTMYCKTTKKSAPKKRNREERLSGSTVQDDSPADAVVYAAVDKSVLMKNRQQDDVVKSDVIKDQNDDSDTMYSEVIKHPKKQQIVEKKEKKKSEEKELKENKDEAGASTSNDNSRSTNQDGLVYIDVEFARKPPSSDTKGRPVIHGEEEKTEYTFVDFSQKAPPTQETQENVK